MINDIRKEKSTVVERCTNLFEESSYVFIVRYSGMTAEEMSALRNTLKRDAMNQKLVIFKNTLTFLGSKKTRFSDIFTSKFKGQIGLVFTSNPLEVAKVLDKFVNSTKLEFVMYSDSQNNYDVKDLKRLSQLPSLSILRARVLGVLSGSQSSLLQVLKEPASALTRVLGARSEGGCL